MYAYIHTHTWLLRMLSVYVTVKLLVTQLCWASLVAQLVKNLPAMQETWVSISGLGRSPEGGKGYPLQYSGLENSTDHRVHGVAKSHTWLTFTFTFTKGLQYTYLSLKVYLKVILSYFMCNLRILQKYSSFIPFWSRCYYCHVFILLLISTTSV